MGIETLLLDGGPVRATEIQRAGISRQRVTELVAELALTPVLRGVYLPTNLLRDVSARAAAVALVLPPGAAVCRRTAAWLHGVDARAPGAHTQPPPLECLVPRGRVPLRRPGVASFASDLPSGEICMVDGVPTTTPDRTALDLARWGERFTGLATLDAFAHAGLIDLGSLRERVTALSGQRHVAQARQLVELCEPKTESFGESWMRLRMIDAGLPRPTVQVSLRDRKGVEIYRLDTGYEEHRVAAEYDGEQFHGRSVGQRRADEGRRAAVLARFGWTVIGFTSENVLAGRPPVELTVAEMISWTQPLRRRLW
jgi:very-short-patch-repair endonuclease